LTHAPNAAAFGLTEASWKKSVNDWAATMTVHAVPWPPNPFVRLFSAMTTDMTARATTIVDVTTMTMIIVTAKKNPAYVASWIFLTDPSRVLPG